MAEAIKKTRKPRVKKVVEAVENPEVVEVPEAPTVPEVVEALEDAVLPKGLVTVKCIVVSRPWTSTGPLAFDEVACVSPEDAEILLAAGMVERI